MPLACSAQNWPAFRGGETNGTSDKRPLPVSWNADSSVGAVKGVGWRTALPGLSHSSPVVWGRRIYLTSAVAHSTKQTVKLGATGEPTAADDAQPHEWVVLCFDRDTGKEVWRRTAWKGSPRVTRHVKATQANTTVSTNGSVLVAFFGSEGLHCYDMNGKLLWTQDLGKINVAKYGIGWGYGSSPALHGGTIVVLCDAPDGPYIAAHRLADGKELWRVSRNGLCERSWGTPFVYASGRRTQVVTNGWPWIISYDLETGRELWRLRGGGDNPIPTPFAVDGLIYVTNAHGGPSPIFAVRPDASGDISPTAEQAGKFIEWSTDQGGSYISTPVIYRGLMYFGNTNGVLRCFESRTGKKLYEERLGPGASIYASLTAGDGKVYCPSEDGAVYVVAAGPDFRLLATNSLGEACFATPAISEGRLFFRTTSSLNGDWKRVAPLDAEFVAGGFHAVDDALADGSDVIR